MTIHKFTFSVPVPVPVKFEKIIDLIQARTTGREQMTTTKLLNKYFKQS